MTEVNTINTLSDALVVGKELFLVREPEASVLRSRIEDIGLDHFGTLALHELSTLVQSLELLLDRKGLEPCPFPNPEDLAPSDCFQLELLNQVSCSIYPVHSSLVMWRQLFDLLRMMGKIVSYSS